jgi:hypothetical protein
MSTSNLGVQHPIPWTEGLHLIVIQIEGGLRGGIEVRARDSTDTLTLIATVCDRNITHASWSSTIMSAWMDRVDGVF